MAKNSFQGILDLKEYLTTETSTEKAKTIKAYTLFKEIYGNKFVIENDAEGADGYVEGTFVLELKTHYEDWLAGLFQALHYKKKGLSFPYVIVICHHFLGVWRLAPKRVLAPGDSDKALPPIVMEIAAQTEAFMAPNEVGKTNAHKLTAAQKEQVLESARFLIHKPDFKLTKKETEAKFRDKSSEGLSELRLYEFKQYLNNLEAGRIQINTQNFVQVIEAMERFFYEPLEAIHAFYSMVNFWDITSTLAGFDEYGNDAGEVRLVGRNGRALSELLPVLPDQRKAFRRFVEERFIFTNEGSGLTLDYYFSRFDEVLARLMPNYVKQHGIFFTDDNLSKFALWFVQEYFDSSMRDKYIVFDPAGGSGNLVTSWRLQLKHKIVSELQPDLLRIIERRMQFDPEQLQQGFTVVPKTNLSEGLNFLDKSAEDYFNILKSALSEKRLALDKPFAFLLNPPYKNTDENEESRAEAEAHYKNHPDILELTGNDAGNERYLAFIAQILLLARLQTQENPAHHPLMMIFTPTSWLIPRPSYAPFRTVFDQEFEYINGFLVKAGEFFKLPGVGNWPVTFTLWKYSPVPGRKNEISLFDFTDWTREDLSEINWIERESILRGQIKEAIVSKKRVVKLKPRPDIREMVPELGGRRQARYDFSRAKRVDETDRIVSGFPLRDNHNHFILKRTCGEPGGAFIGLMDDGTPVRLGPDNYNRIGTLPDRIWFRLDQDIKSGNRTRLLNAPPDKYGYCAFDLGSAKSLLAWFAITKILNGKYPLWANQFDLWPPKINQEKADLFYSLCFAFGLAENRSLVIKFEAGNPAPGAPEIFLDNPLAPTHPDNFWSEVLAPHASTHPLAGRLVKAVTDLYRYWDQNVTKGRHDVYGYGLEDEPYFKYFSYAPFVTPYSGLVQIRKVAQTQAHSGLLERIEAVSDAKRGAQDALYGMLVEDFGYFQ